jgi:hypothetical protein
MLVAEWNMYLGYNCEVLGLWINQQVDVVFENIFL